MVETVNEEVLALPVQQTEGTELRNTIEEEGDKDEEEVEANAVQDEIASNPSDKAKDAENMSIIVLVLAAYVVYQILQLKLCQLFRTWIAW